jgi:hypothetical protein
LSLRRCFNGMQVHVCYRRDQEAPIAPSVSDIGVESHVTQFRVRS